MSKRIVVVGHGMVGQRFLETLTQNSSDFRITVLAEEPRLAYDRVNLSKYFSGSTVEDLTLTDRDFFDSNGIELHSGDPVAAIDRVNKRVTTKSGAEYEYDTLILASKLREALNDSPTAPRFIETIARRGYRFLAPVATAPYVFPILRP